MSLGFGYNFRILSTTHFGIISRFSKTPSLSAASFLARYLTSFHPFILFIIFQYREYNVLRMPLFALHAFWPRPRKSTGRTVTHGSEKQNEHSLTSCRLIVAGRFGSTVPPAGCGSCIAEPLVIGILPVFWTSAAMLSEPGSRFAGGGLTGSLRLRFCCSQGWTL